MSNKRFDIQGIRAWAVIAVVIFHFFPSALPWGYLGVDVFFVLSGFLISLVLDRKPCAFATYLDFYFKRFKRIFPLAILIALINLIAISLKDDLKLVKMGTKSAIYAIAFATNYNVRDAGEDYFEALEQANDYFTHYWSLSVEIQFYVLAPILLHMLRPAATNPARLLTYLSSLALCSLALSLTLKPEDAFSSTLCRLWQFSAGSIAFNLGKMSSSHRPLPLNDGAVSQVIRPFSSYFYGIPFGAALLASVIIRCSGNDPSLTRLSVTVAATFLLVIQSTSSLLCHQYLQLLGDSSYALYLIHWPVVCVLKDWEVHDSSFLLAAMLTCVALSILVHVTYEKWYLSLSMGQTFALVGVLYISYFCFVFSNSTRKPRPLAAGEFDPEETLLRWEPGTSTNFTDDQVWQMNKVLGKQLADSLTIPNCTPRIDKEKNDRFKFCTFPNGRGKDSFLIIGNSYALSPGKLVLKHFKKHYGSISIRAVPHCEPLILTKHNMCRSVHHAHKKFLEDVERERPDVLFISSRYENPGVPINGNITSDSLYLYMLEKLNVYEKLVKKKVFILNSFPQVKSPKDAENIRKAKKLPLEAYMPEAIIADDEPMRERTKELAKNCEKCVFYDIRLPHLDKNGHFMTLDPESKLRYFEHTVHYTSVGLKVIEPVFTELSKEYEHLLAAKYPDNMFEWKR